MRIYIASSWKNQHAVEMLTALLRAHGHEVISWVENNYEEGYTATGATDFEKWVKTESAEKAFEYDTHGAMTCELFIYVGPAGKDAAAECGLCYGQRLAGKTIPMLALYAKGEDFGLMRKMFEGWYGRYTDILEVVENFADPLPTKNNHPCP